MNETQHFVRMQKLSFFSIDKNGSSIIASEENFPPILALTLKLPQSLTPTERAIFFRGNCPDTGKNTRNEKPRLCFIKLNKLFRKLEL